MTDVSNELESEWHKSSGMSKTFTNVSHCPGVVTETLGEPFDFHLMLVDNLDVPFKDVYLSETDARKTRWNFLAHDFFNYEGVKGEIVIDSNVTRLVGIQFLPTSY